MTAIVRMIRNLEQRPIVEPVAGVRLRHFRDEDDAERWLEIRHKAFGHQRLGVRAWTRSDFQREFLDQPWWRPELMWFAEVPMLQTGAPGEGTGGFRSVGTIGLALRPMKTAAGPVVRPAIQWLAVLPAWRRRGIGRCLVQSAERRCWDLGYRQIGLETHHAWREAVALYERMGYRLDRS